MQTPAPPSAYVPPAADPAVLAALLAAVLADPARTDRIAALERRDEAIAALVDWGLELGLELDRDRLNQSLGADVIGLDRFVARPVTGHERPGPRWLPVGLSNDGAQLTVDWAHFGQDRLDSSFFETDLRLARTRPVTRLLQWRTPLGGLIEQFGQDAPRLDGLIFHMSRCGSTLVTQSLAALPGTLALSEPPPLDEVVQLCQARGDFDPQVKLALMRAMVSVLTMGVGDPSETRRRFIKTDCWHAGALPLFRAAFPDTPWICLFRDPLDVLNSHEAMPGSQTLPGAHAALVGIDDPEAVPGLDFSARVLAATCHAAADHAALGGGLFIDYADLPGALWDRILPHFGIAPDAQETALIAAALQRDAKQPQKKFDAQERTPASQASPAVRAASAAHLAPAVDRLRALAVQVTD